MPLSFPSSPAVGQQSVQNGRTFSWTGYAWELASSGDDARWDYFKPAAPTGVTATATNAQAVVSWTAPAVAVPPLTDYTVQFSTNGGSTWTTANDSVSNGTSATITGLSNNVATVFRVAGVNGIGTGAYSTASAAVTPVVGTPPNAPTSLTANAGNAQLALAWTAPSAPGTYSITHYSIEYTQAATGYTLSGSTTTAANGNYTTSGTISDNPSWQHASADYVLSYAGGDGTGWMLFPGTITGGYTGGPIASQVCGYAGGGDGTCSQGSITGAWNENISSGAGSITVAAATGSPQTVSTGSTGTSYTLTGLTNGTAYTVRVAGVSAAGTGAYSSTVSRTPSASSAPTAVRNLVAPAGDCNAMASWDAPSSDGGSAITGYRVVISSGMDNSGTTTQAANVRTKEIIQTYAVNFTVTVYAINAVGESPGVAVSSITGNCS
jgi:hypothetical protein